MTLIAVAILSGCSTVPKNSSLTEVHTKYNEARNNPQVTSLAAVELKEAGDSLDKADQALSQGESEATVNKLAYVANQQVRIAQETAFRKTDELTITNADSKRNQVRLEARTAEAEAAKQQVLVVQETLNQQNAELAAANANAVSDQALISQQEEQLRTLNAKQTKRGLVITLGDVLFNTSKAHLKAGGAHSVQKLADFLNQFPQHKVLIEGYTDSTGNSIKNQALSEQRANAVRAALIDRGISSDRIVTRGYGERFPIADNSTGANRQLNRRVEIVLSDNNGNITSR